MKKSFIQKLVSEAQKRGYEVSIRNIAYALMRVKFDDKLTAYTVIMGHGPDKDSDVDTYDEMESIQFLIRWFQKDLAPNMEESKSTQDIIKAIAGCTPGGTDDDLISFEENYAGAVAQLKRIEALREQCPKEDIKTLKDLEKTESDIRVRLVDKFNVQEKEQKKWLIVPKVFDYICPWTRHECYQINKEDAMQKWHLIPDPNHKEK